MLWGLGIALLSKCMEQVTNLNCARIFRIIQESDGTVVFSLKIPDAATHKSAQHLLGMTGLRLGPEQ